MNMSQSFSNTTWNFYLTKEGETQHFALRRNASNYSLILSATDHKDLIFHGLKRITKENHQAVVAEWIDHVKSKKRELRIASIPNFGLGLSLEQLEKARTGYFSDSDGNEYAIYTKRNNIG